MILDYFIDLAAEVPGGTEPKGQTVETGEESVRGVHREEGPEIHRLAVPEEVEPLRRIHRHRDHLEGRDPHRPFIVKDLANIRLKNTSINIGTEIFRMNYNFF